MTSETIEIEKYKIVWMYLPEKKIPSTQAKATSLSANELKLHVVPNKMQKEIYASSNRCHYSPEYSK